MDILNSVLTYCLTMVVTEDQQQRQILDDCHPTNTTFLVPTIPIIVAAGFLGAQELCALSTTSKELHHMVNQDNVWASLTLRHYPCVELLPRSVLEGNGYQYAYRMYSASLMTNREKPSCPMPPPRLTVNDMELHLQLKYKNKCVLAVPLSGDFLFLSQTGSVSCDLTKPVALTKAKWAMYDQVDLETSEDFAGHKDEKGRYPIWGEDLGFGDFEIAVHLVDKTDYSMCCVFDSRKKPISVSMLGHPFAHPVKNSTEEEVLPNSGMKTGDQRFQCVLFGPNMFSGQQGVKEVQRHRLTLSFSEAANAIANRLSVPIAFR